MQLFRDRIFDDIDDRPLFPWQRGRVMEDAEFRGCQFHSCSISVTADPARRSRARHIRLSGCTTQAVSIYSLIAEEVVVEDLTTVQLLQASGAVFKHVLLRGRIGSLMISLVPVGLGSTVHRNALLRANMNYYNSVDWALDITEAEFEDADLRGVPGHLVRRDVSTQFLIKRERAIEGKWKNLDLSDTHLPVVLSRLAGSNLESEVLVAGKRARDFKKVLGALNRLRDAGIAEPD